VFGDPIRLLSLQQDHYSGARGTQPPCRSVTTPYTPCHTKQDEMSEEQEVATIPLVEERIRHQARDRGWAAAGPAVGGGSPIRSTGAFDMRMSATRAVLI
jgi:hypothetical protein